MKKKRGKIFRFLVFFGRNNLWLILILILHLMLANSFFPYDQLLSKKPFTTCDHPMKYYNLYTAKKLLMQGKLSAFDPYLMESDGGILSTYHTFPILLATIFFFVPGVYIYKFYIFLLYLLAPIAIYFAAKNFGLKKEERYIALLLAVISIRFNYLINEHVFWGLNAYFFVSFLSIFTASLLYRFIKFRKSKFLYIGLSLLLFLLFIHPLSITIFFPFLILGWYIYKKSTKKQKIIIWGVVAAFVVLCLSLYLNKLILYLTSLKWGQYFDVTFLGLFSFFTYDILSAIIILSGFFGIILWRNNKVLFYLFFVSSFYYISSPLISLIHIFLHFRFYRLRSPLVLLLIIPSSRFFYYIFKSARLKVTKRTLFLIISVTALLLSFFLVSHFNIEQQIGSGLDRKIEVSMPKDVLDLMNWIEHNTTLQGRIMIENSGINTGFVYGGIDIPLIAKDTKRLFCAHYWPYLSLNIIKDYYMPVFNEGQIFNHNIVNFNSDILLELFDRYNIRWVISWSYDNLDSIFPKVFKKQSQIGKFAVYETMIKPSFFINGSGNISFDYGIINITNATMGSIIVKSYYSDDLRTDPPLKLDRYMPADFQWRPFVEVKNGNITNFTIYSKRLFEK